LGDIFACAARAAGNQTAEALRQWLTVDPRSLTTVYRLWFSMPWDRIYTLNVDDLDEAVQVAYTLPIKLRCVSALQDTIPTGNETMYIHLNGRVADYPDVTFSPTQYAVRAASHDPWYFHLVTDLVRHPVLFVGTGLDEDLLWQHIELRRTKERGMKELRPG